MKKPWIRPVLVEVDLSATHPDLVTELSAQLMKTLPGEASPPAEELMDEALEEQHKQALAALLAAPQEHSQT